MHKNNKIRWLGFFILAFVGLLQAQPLELREYTTVTVGAARFNEYLPLLKNKRVGVVTNITGVLGETSIVDTLIRLKVKVVKIFGPEHGFRSNVDAGLKVKSNKDPKTGLPIVSLYGSNKKPTKDQLKNIDVLIYDIQDIGVRFYTYISTMCYAMEACAENKKEFIVLDRPNPNGFFIDGPLLQPKYTSFLGLHAVPIVYGMTCGEYAKMANEEGWSKNKVKAKLTVIPMANYERKASYKLPVKPSPNIPNERAVILYPNLGLFEGTIVGLGRGTEFPFQVIGHPKYPDTSFCFIPTPSDIVTAPRYMNQKCYGLDLREADYISNHPRQIELKWLRSMYTALKDPGFFEANFNYHVGNNLLQEQIKAGLPEEEIRSSWAEELSSFKLIRKKYLLYPDIQ